MGGSHTKGDAKPILAGIQLLRGLAACMVVLAHDNEMMQFGRYFHKSAVPIDQSGIFGVSVFFVISGFIIAYVSLGGDLKPKFTVRDYARRRFLRIVPFLWLSVIGYNLLSFAGTHQIDWWPALGAMFIFPIGELKPNVVWSLRHELLFYVLFAISMMGARRRLWVLIPWFAAPLFYQGLLQITHGAAAPGNPALADLLQVVLGGSGTGANLQFCMGFTLGLLFLRGNPLTTPRLRGGLIITLVVTVAAAALVEALALPPGLERSLLWTVLAAIIVWLGLISLPSDNWFQKVGIALGDASFAIYLIHNGVLLVLLEASRSLHHTIPLGLFFAVSASAAIVIGVIAHYLIEAPLIKWLSHGKPIVPWQVGRRPQKSQTN